MEKKSFKDAPLAEITLRRYEKPYNAANKRELVKKLCLSTGLLQPGDSRDIIVDVFFVLLQARQEEKQLSSENVKDLVVLLRKAEGLPLQGIASSNIRRQIKRLRGLYLVEKVKNNYRITEQETITNIFQDKFETILLPSLVSRVKEYTKVVDDAFRK